MAQWEPLFAVNTAPCLGPGDEEYGVGKEKNKEYLTIFRESYGKEQEPKKSHSTRSPVFEAKSRIRWQTDTLGI